MNIILKNGESMQLEDGATCMQAASAISEGLARNAVCAKVNGEAVDLSHVLKEGDSLEIVTLKDKEGLHVYRHTCAHVLAQALKTIYPTCKLAIGPVIENGFYYDIDFVTPITKEDLAKIEAEMQKIIKSNLPVERFVLPREEALKLMEGYDEKYKVNLSKICPKEKRFPSINKAILPTFAAVRTFLPPEKSRRSSSSISRAPIGEGTNTIKCSPVFTVRLSQKRTKWKPISTCSKRQKSATIPSSEKSIKLFTLLNEGKGFSLLSAARHDSEKRARRILETDSRPRGVCRSVHAHYAQPFSLGNFGALGPL